MRTLETMRNRSAGEPEFIPIELHRISVEEFEMWDDEPCLAAAD